MANDPRSGEASHSSISSLWTLSVCVCCPVSSVDASMFKCFSKDEAIYNCGHITKGLKTHTYTNYIRITTQMTSIPRLALYEVVLLLELYSLCCPLVILTLSGVFSLYFKVSLSLSLCVSLFIRI